MPPRSHRTPPELVAATASEGVAVEGRVFRVERPADPDGVLRDPAVVSAGAADEYVPYWVRLWPAARMLAAAVVREPWENYPRPVRVLEVGCGLGLAGIACLARGLEVTFSDVDETALAFAAANARLNGFTRGFRTQLLDFRSPPDDANYPVVIGSDLIYRDDTVIPLTRFLKAVLAPGGVCLVTDPDRATRNRFLWHLAEVGLTAEADAARVGDGGPGLTGTLYRVRHRGERK